MSLSISQNKSLQIAVDPTDAQKEAFKFCVSRNQGLVAMETGSGKTVLEILILMYYLQKGLADKGIIVCTPSSMIEIRTEIQSRTPLKAMICDGAGSFRKFMKNERTSVALVTYEIYREQEWFSPKRMGFVDDIRQVWCFDEVHMVKNPGATKSLFFNRIRPWMTYCYGFSATPMTQGLMDLFHIINFLSPGFLGDEFVFRQNYINVQKTKKVTTYGIKNKTDNAGYKNLDRLKKRIEQIAYFNYSERDVRFHTHFSDLDDKGLLRYEAVARGVFAEDSENLERSVSQYGGQLQALQRIVDESYAKRSQFQDLAMENRDRGIVVFSGYHKTCEIIADELADAEIDFRVITGREDPFMRKKAKQWFTRDPKNKALIVTTAGGQSLNLQATNCLICYNVPQGVGNFIQLIGRIVRMNTPWDHYDVHFVCVRDTIDEYRYYMVEKNKNVFKNVMGLGYLPGAEGTDYNSDVLTRLREFLLWRRREKESVHSDKDLEGIWRS